MNGDNNNILPQPYQPLAANQADDSAPTPQLSEEDQQRAALREVMIEELVRAGIIEQPPTPGTISLAELGKRQN